MADARCVRRRMPIVALGRRRVEFRQLESSVAVRGLQHDDRCPDAVEPHNAVHPAAFDGPLPCGSSPSSTKNSVAAARSSTTIHVVQPLDPHALDGKDATVEPGNVRRKRSRGQRDGADVPAVHLGRRPVRRPDGLAHPAGQARLVRAVQRTARSLPCPIGTCPSPRCSVNVTDPTAVVGG
jgi:hypothetical protein